jgi:hypothetical protein
MKKIDIRQNKLAQMRPRQTFLKADIQAKKGRRYDSKLDRRGMK